MPVARHLEASGLPQEATSSVKPFKDTKNVNVSICGEDGGCDGCCQCGYNLLWMLTIGWIFFLIYSLLALLTLPFLFCGWDFSNRTGRWGKGNFFQTNCGRI